MSKVSQPSKREQQAIAAAQKRAKEHYRERPGDPDHQERHIVRGVGDMRFVGARWAIYVKAVHLAPQQDEKNLAAVARHADVRSVTVTAVDSIATRIEIVLNTVSHRKELMDVLGRSIAPSDRYDIRKWGPVSA